MGLSGRGRSHTRAPRRGCDVNRLPRVLITLATAFVFALCAHAQTPAPRVVPERESRSAPEDAKDVGAEKARLEFEGLRYHYGSVKVKGVTAFFPEQIVEMLDARPGEVVDGSKMVDMIANRVKEEYGDRGICSTTSR